MVGAPPHTGVAGGSVAPPPHLALAAVYGVTAMASPTSGLNVVAVAVVLAAAIVLLVSHLIPHLADLLLPPALSGATFAQ